MSRSARPSVLGITILVTAAACGGQAAPAAAPTVTASVPAPSPTRAEAVQLTSGELDEPLVPATYHVGAPFGAAFSVTLPTEWTLKALGDGDVEFVNSGRGDRGVAWLVVDLVENVFSDPCHATGPSVPPVAKTVGDVVAAVARMKGYRAGPVTDVMVGGRPGKAVEIANTIDTETAACIGGKMLPMWTFTGGGAAQTNGGATEQLWIVDVAGTPVILDGETFPETPAGSKEEIRDIVSSLTFA